MSRVLVTGASGFIGRPMLPMLRDAGHEVHAVSSRPQPEEAGVTWHQADLLDPPAATALIEAAEPTHLVHLAWYTEHGANWESDENLRWKEASIRLWSEFAAGGGRRGVVAGTCAEYRWGEDLVLSETSPVAPSTLYGRAKNELRRALESEAADGPTLGWARIFFPYGPGEGPGRLIPSVASALLEGSEARTTAGEQVRDFVYVEDVAAALAAMLESGLEGTVNVGSGSGTAVREVVETLGRLTGRPELLEIGAIPPREDDPPSVVADIGRLREELGWRPLVTMGDGLSRVVAALRA